MHERFSEVLKLLKLTQTEIAKALNMEQGTISGWTKGNNITKKNLILLEEKFGINSNYILTGIGEPLIIYKKSIDNIPIIIQEPLENYRLELSTNDYIAIIKSLKQQLKDLHEKVNKLEMEAENLRQQKYNYRKPLTKQQQDSLHNKGAPQIGQKRHSPK